MDLCVAKDSFMQLLSGVNPESVCDFLEWIQNSEQFKCKEAADIILENISEDLRSCVPFEAVFPSEKLVTPTAGKNADCEEEVLAHVDSFLFSDDYIDDLVETGQFSRNYCNKCHSKDTKPLTFISHSMSASCVKFLFKKILPDLSGKTLIDVGSRLGPVLYGAFLYSSCKRIIGIEINENLCAVQNNIIEKYGMTSRVSIINSDVSDCSAILQSGDIIIMNNVFEFFADKLHIKTLWSFIINTLKNSNKLLVTFPSLEESLEPIGLSHLLNGFAKEIPLETEQCEDAEDAHFYQVMSNS